MIKVTKAQFELFKKECKKWIDRFELNNWDVYFVNTALDDSTIARTKTNIDTYDATIALNLKWSEELPLNREQLIKTAEHEILHVLIARLDCLAHSRYAKKDELDSANEELVQKLSHIIK